MYTFRLMLDENKSYLNNPTTLADITCLSVEDFKSQLRKDAELYIIKDIVPERHNLACDDYKQMMKEWRSELSKQPGASLPLTTDANGELVKISHVLTDPGGSISVFPSSHKSFRKDSLG